MIIEREYRSFKSSKEMVSPVTYIDFMANQEIAEEALVNVSYKKYRIEKRKRRWRF